MKIIDCVMFFNELDVLDIRINELDEVVDQFNIIESPFTFQGNPKPLFFDINRERYKKFSHKIRHFVFDGAPDAPLSWHREYAQREFVKSTVGSEDPESKVIISDVDEIPNHSSIRIAKEKSISFFEMTNFYYYMDWASNVRFVQAMMMSVGELSKVEDLSQLRMNSWDRRFEPGRYDADLIANAGWHLSWLGGVDKIMEKLASFSHTEPEAQRHADPEHIKRCIESQVFFEEHQLKRCSITDLPKYVQSNQQYFLDLGFLSPRPATDFA